MNHSAKLQSTSIPIHSWFHRRSFASAICFSVTSREFFSFVAGDVWGEKKLERNCGKHCAFLPTDRVGGLLLYSGGTWKHSACLGSWPADASCRNLRRWRNFSDSTELISECEAHSFIFQPSPINKNKNKKKITEENVNSRNDNAASCFKFLNNAVNHRTRLRLKIDL